MFDHAECLWHSIVELSSRQSKRRLKAERREKSESYWERLGLL